MNKYYFVIFFVMISFFAYGYSIEEIEKMKKLGFTNEQIVDMQKSATNNNTTVTSESSKINIKAIEKLKTLEGQSKGLLCVYLTREFTQPGPGFLDMQVQDSSKKWMNIGKILSLDFSNKEGGAGSVAYVCVDPNTLCSVAVANKIDMVISKYYAEFPFDEGQYEIMISKKLTNDGAFGFGDKLKRHKIFHKVPIKAGKATLIAYNWDENFLFGEDTRFSDAHNAYVKYLKEQYGEFLNTSNGQTDLQK